VVVVREIELDRLFRTVTPFLSLITVNILIMVKNKSIQEDDAAYLASMGHTQELKRNFSTLSMLGLAFAILNSWTALSASLSLALPSGGPASIIWGLVTAGICDLYLAASLAEFLSAYPIAGGQCHWVAMISWKPWVPILSWTTGWINVSGWIALTATGGLLEAN
jgi:choline transport protein